MKRYILLDHKILSGDTEAINCESYAVFQRSYDAPAQISPRGRTSHKIPLPGHSRLELDVFICRLLDTLFSDSR